jgi:hypothetical protein
LLGWLMKLEEPDLSYNRMYPPPHS